MIIIGEKKNPMGIVLSSLAGWSASFLTFAKKLISIGNENEKKNVSVCQTITLYNYILFGP